MKCVYFGLALLFPALAPLAGRAETVWWEAEAAKETTMPVKDDTTSSLSGGKWLTGPVGDGLSATYDVSVAQGGRYDFLIRRFWLHGAFRWRFDEGDWVNAQGIKQEIVDQVTAPMGVLSWVDLGYATLAAGKHTLRIEILTGAQTTHPANFNKAYGFDCFVLSNDGFAPKGLDPAGGPHHLVALPDPATFGLHMARTMALLESATPEHRTPVTILCYGQSIVANSHIDLLLAKFLREKYPNAVIKCVNTAIGGYEAPILRRTSWQDLYPENPDLIVFHDYGGDTGGGELEEMFKGIQDNMTADVITWTHHVDTLGVDKQRDAGAEFLKGMGAKYNYEMVDLRTLWKEYLKETHIDPADLLVDKMIHLNGKGSDFLLQSLIPRFTVNPAAGEGWKKRVQTFPLNVDQSANGIIFDAASWTASTDGLVSKGTGALKIAFTGNRIDLVGLTGGTGSAKVLLDGQVPSTQRDTLAASRSTVAPGAWWPVVTRATLSDQAVVEKVTLHFHDIAPDGSAYAFDASGSVSGDEGKGVSGADFVSKSGRVAIKAEDIAFDKVKKITKKDLPPQLDVEFDVHSMSLDTWRPPAVAVQRPGRVYQEVVVRCWKNGPHVVEIVPNGDGPVGIGQIMTFTPGVRD